MKIVEIHEPSKECVYRLAFIYDDKFKDSSSLKQNIQNIINIFAEYIETVLSIQELKDYRDDNLYFTNDKKEINDKINLLSSNKLEHEKIIQDIDPYAWDIIKTNRKPFSYAFFKKVEADYVLTLCEKEWWFDTRRWYEERRLKEILGDE